MRIDVIKSTTKYFLDLIDDSEPPRDLDYYRQKNEENGKYQHLINELASVNDDSQFTRYVCVYCGPNDELQRKFYDVVQRNENLKRSMNTPLTLLEVEYGLIKLDYAIGKESYYVITRPENKSYYDDEHTMNLLRYDLEN